LSGFLGSLGGLRASSKESINLSAVGGIGDDVGHFASHLIFVECIKTIELFPELFIVRLGRLVIEFNSTETHSFKDSHGSFETFIVSEVLELASTCHHVDAESGVTGHVNPSAEGGSVLGRDLTRLNDTCVSESEHVFTVVLPDSHEMGLVRDLRCLFVGENHVLLLNDFWGQFGEDFVLLLELGTSLRGGGVHTEDNLAILVGVGERPEESVTFLIITSFFC
jgi:hypothetical protein